MKKSLLAGFTALLFASTVLAGCNPSSTSSGPTTGGSDTSTSTTDDVAKVVKVGDINQIDFETRKSVLDGQFVRIEGVIVSAILDGSFNVQEQVLTDQTNPLRHLEVLGTHEVSHASKVNLTGTVSMNKGHICLADATVEKAPSNPNEDGIYNYINFSRAAYDASSSMIANGNVYNGVVVPTTYELPTLKLGEGATIPVTFPGEDNDTSKEDNPFIIDLVIPSVVSQNAVNRWNRDIVTKMATAKEAGGINIFTSVYYNEGVAQLILDDFGLLAGSSAGYATDVVEIEGVYKTFADASTEYLPEYILPSDLAKFPALDNENAFSFVVDTSLYLDYVEQFGGLLTVTVPSYNTADLLTTYVNAFTASENWDSAGEQDGYYFFATKDQAMVVVLADQFHNVMIEIHNYNLTILVNEGANSAAGIFGEYQNLMREYETANLVDLGTVTEEGQESTWTSKIADPTEILTTNEAEIYATSLFRSKEESKLEEKTIVETIQVLFTLTNASKLSTLMKGYLDTFATNGFTEVVLGTDEDGEEIIGYFNTTSRELVNAGFYNTGIEGLYALVLEINVLDSSLPTPPAPTPAA